jgi:hypothetical protein
VVEGYAHVGLTMAISLYFSNGEYSHRCPAIFRGLIRGYHLPLLGTSATI